VEGRLPGQLGQDVPEAMDGAATAVGVGPQLGDRPDEPRCPVADDEKRAAQTAAAQAAPEVEPVLGSLPLSEADVEQDWVATMKRSDIDEGGRISE
jgi:broad specificity phosphatase PhoE